MVMKKNASITENKELMMIENHKQNIREMKTYYEKCQSGWIWVLRQ